MGAQHPHSAQEQPCDVVELPGTSVNMAAVPDGDTSALSAAHSLPVTTAGGDLPHLRSCCHCYV